MNQSPKHTYEFGPFRLDAQERLLSRAGESVSLTPKAFDLLLALVERQGRLVEKEELFQAVWPDSFVEESNLSSNIALIRKALKDGENGLKFIETVPKRGYRFVAEVRETLPTRGETASIQEQPTVNPPLETTTSLPAQRTSLWARPVFIIAFGLSGLMICVAVWWMFSRRLPEPSPPQIAQFTAFPGSESQPSFSPDGSQIAFVWNGEQGDNDDIYIKQIGNETLVRLTTNPAPDQSPCWSPDGRWIAFTRRTTEENGLYLIPALGGAERKIAALSLTLLPEFLLRLSWTPDSEWLAVKDKPSAAEPASIYLVRQETGEKRKLTTPPADSEDGEPTISPDGKTVAFRRTRDRVNHLYLIPITGGEPQQFQFDQETSVNLPTWTPDGRSLLFNSNRGGGLARLWKVPATGGTPVRVDVDEQNLAHLALSRQGNRLAWTQSVNDTNIWRLELDETGKAKAAPQQLIASTRLDMSAQFSPDGSKIVFASERSGSWQIWVCQSDGQHPVQLTALKPTPLGDALTGSPRWSPDGRQIVFDSRVEGSADIYVISSEGGKPRRLTTESSDEINPGWSRDGQWIYFSSNRSGSQQLWKLPVAGGPTVRVTKQGGFESVESPDGQWIYFTKGYRVPGIWRVPVAGGEETLVLDSHGVGQWRYWAVTEQGIWFATAEQPNKPLIEFFSFATHKVTPVTTLEKRIGFFGFSGLDVSPDGRWLIWQQLDQAGSDIMLLENFR